jgi:hypothetical protein
MPPPRSRRTSLILLAAALVAAVGWFLAVRGKTPSLPPSGGVVTHSPVSTPPLDNPPESFLDRWLSGPSPSDAAKSLADLKNHLASLSAAEAVATIRIFLASGRDKPTGLSFEIAADGSLKEAPTLRTFLLDALAAIDPAAAAEISRQILATPTTADEWALSLRNIGRFDDPATSRDFLRAKTEELIRNPTWQAAPSVGYLNAFDVLVHTAATESAPLLSSLVQNKDRRDLAHAAFLTLDRLVQRQPDEMLGLLAADTALLQSRPEMTAQQFARADLRDAAQREIVKSWLLDPARTATELRSFAGTYPNHNQFISHNLLTTSTAPTGSDLAAHDREVLEILQSWSTDPAFQPVQAHLSSMIARLNQFTKAPAKTEP